MTQIKTQENNAEGAENHENHETETLQTIDDLLYKMVEAVLFQQRFI